MLRRAAIVLIFALLAALPAQTQDKTVTVFAAASMKNAIDDINAAFTKATGIKVVASYRRKLGAGEADRAGRAGGRVRLGRSGVDGLCRAEEAHQGRHPRQSARQQARADRAEGFQDRRRDDRPGLRPRQARGRRPHRERPTCARCRPANMPRRRWRSSAAGPRPSRSSLRRKTCAPRWRWSAAARRRSASSTRPTPRSKRTSRSSAYFPEDSHPPITYPVALTANAKPEAAQYLAFLRSGLAKTVFETYGFTFLIKPTS